MGKTTTRTRAIILSATALAAAIGAFAGPSAFGQSPTTTTTTATTPCPTNTTSAASPATTTTYVGAPQTTTTTTRNATACPTTASTMPFFPTDEDMESPVGEANGAPSVALPLVTLGIIGAAIVVRRRRS